MHRMKLKFDMKLKKIPPKTLDPFQPKLKRIPNTERLTDNVTLDTFPTYLPTYLQRIRLEILD